MCIDIGYIGYNIALLIKAVAEVEKHESSSILHKVCACAGNRNIVPLFIMKMPGQKSI
jgi:hypothetical protein